MVAVLSLTTQLHPPGDKGSCFQLLYHWPCVDRVACCCSLLKPNFSTANSIIKWYRNLIAHAQALCMDKHLLSSSPTKCGLRKRFAVLAGCLGAVASVKIPALKLRPDSVATRTPAFAEKHGSVAVCQLSNQLFGITDLRCPDSRAC